MHLCTNVPVWFFIISSVWFVRWEEERATDGSKWRFLEHKGPVFALPYEPLPLHVRFFCDGEDHSVSETLQRMLLPDDGLIHGDV